jgi:hypothetical protein
MVNEDYSKLLHIPKEMRDQCQEILKNYVLSLSNEEILLTSHPFHEKYRPLVNLILDDITMPNLLSHLEKIGESSRFLISIINYSTFWCAVDKTPKNRQKELYLKTKKQLSKLIEKTHESAEVRHATQVFFEEAFNSLLKKEHYSNITYSKGSRFSGPRYLQFSELIMEMIKTFENYEESFLAQSSNDSVIPRKLNEASSFRTYMTRSVAEEIERIYSKKSYALVADIINVMFPETEPLTHEHVQKLKPKKECSSQKKN